MKRTRPTSTGEYTTKTKKTKTNGAIAKPAFRRSNAANPRYFASDFLPEKKYFDTALSFTLDNTGEVPATGQLVLIPQGDTETTRDGRQCMIESVQIRANMSFQPGASASASTVATLMLVQDTQTNGAAAAVTDVMTSANLWSALIYMPNSNRFKVLKRWDCEFQPGAGVTAAYNSVNHHLEYYSKQKIPLEFSAGTGALTELKSNNLFLLAGAVGSDDLVQVDGNCRVRFRG